MADVIGFDSAAWSIDGARIESDLMRVVAYAATNGSEGVATPGDCKVHQLTVPGNQVVVDTGALFIRNRSAGVRNQTYAVNGRSETRLDVAPTASSARSDLVVVRVRDSEFAPWPKPSAQDAPNYQYVQPFIIQGVPAGTKSAAALNLGYSAYALARIDIPANTSVISDAMIKNTRELHTPRQREYFYQLQPTGPKNVTESEFIRAGNFTPTVPTPEWATHVTISATIASVGHTGGWTLGDWRISFGNTVFGPWIIYDIDTNGPDRAAHVVGATAAVPTSLRGTDTQVGVDVKRNPSMPGYLVIDTRSTITINVMFEERAV